HTLKILRERKSAPRNGGLKEATKRADGLFLLPQGFKNLPAPGFFNRAESLPQPGTSGQAHHQHEKALPHYGHPIHPTHLPASFRLDSKEAASNAISQISPISRTPTMSIPGTGLQ